MRLHIYKYMANSIKPRGHIYFNTWENNISTAPVHICGSQILFTRLYTYRRVRPFGNRNNHLTPTHDALADPIPLTSLPIMTSGPGYRGYRGLLRCDSSADPTTLYTLLLNDFGSVISAGSHRWFCHAKGLRT